jgi:hypothetical protein
MSGKMTDMEEIKTRAASLGVLFQDMQYIVCVFEPEMNENNRKKSIYDESLYKAAIMTKTENIIGAAYQCHLFNVDSRVGVLIKGKEISKQQIHGFCCTVKDWLNNVAADAVERVFGYGARNFMHRAIAKIDRVIDKVRNRSTIYTKKNNLDTHFLKTEIISEAPVYEIDREVLDEIKKQGELVQEFGYKGAIE